MKHVQLAAAVALATVLAPPLAHSETVKFEYGAECRKNSTRGCTGDQTSCYQAPSDRLIMRSSVRIEMSHSGRSPRCIPSYHEMRTVSVTTQGGQSFQITEPTRVCINAHIESGSGAQNLGKGFNVKCFATFEVQETE